MQISFTGIALIKRHEGLRHRAYLCPGNIWTIGFGHTKTTYAGQVINTRQAESLLQRDLREVESTLEDNVRVKLTQNQYDVLCSFIFNVGAKAFVESTLLKRLNKQDYPSVTSQLLRWVNAAGRPLPGLLRRRQEEAALWLIPDDELQNEPQVTLSPEPKSGKKLTQSTTALSATVAGTTAALTTVRETLRPLEEARETATTTTDLWHYILTHPLPLLGVIGVSAALYIIFERARHAREDGI